MIVRDNPKGLLEPDGPDYDNDAWRALSKAPEVWDGALQCYVAPCADCGKLVELGLSEGRFEPFRGYAEGCDYFHKDCYERPLAPLPVLSC